VVNERYNLGPTELDLLERKEINVVDETKLNMAENLEGLKKTINNEGY